MRTSPTHPLRSLAAVLTLVLGVGVTAGDPPDTPDADPAGRDRDTRVDAREFGAIPGDGLPDTDALRRALDAVPHSGGTLYLAGGDFHVTDTLVIGRGRLSVECDGARLVVAGPGVKLLHFRGAGATGGTIRDIRVRGCGFFDPAPLDHVSIDESHGIVVDRVSGAHLAELSFENIGDESVDIVNSRDVRLLDSHATGGCAAVASANVGTFGINNSSRVTVRGNTVEANANGSAIRIEVTAAGRDVTHAIVADNLIFDPRDDGGFGHESGSGISVVPARGAARAVHITGNQIVNPYRYGIHVNPVLSGTVTSLIVRGNLVLGGGRGAAEGGGVYRGAINVVGPSAHGVVAANIVDGWGFAASHAGIRVGNDGFALTANVVRDVPGFGLLVQRDGGAGNAVVGNVAVDTGGVEARAGDLVGLNKVDASGSVVFPGLSACELLFTDAAGVTGCVVAAPPIGVSPPATNRSGRPTEAADVQRP